MSQWFQKALRYTKLITCSEMLTDKSLKMVHANCTSLAITYDVIYPSIRCKDKENTRKTVISDSQFVGIIMMVNAKS